MTNRHVLAGIMGVFATALGACSPGYMNASELASKHQGPADCEARCVELGMRMAALVLVSDTLPGCVCQPLQPVLVPAGPTPQPAGPAPATPGPAPAPAPTYPPAPGAVAPISDAAQPGASASTASYVVATMAAAAAARANQTEQRRKAQQSYLPP